MLGTGCVAGNGSTTSLFLPPLPTLLPTADSSQLLTPASETAVPTLTPAPTLLPATPVSSPTPVTPAVTPTAGYALTLTPTQPQEYLSRFRLLAFYGSPTGPGLGLLGEFPRDEMLRRLRETVAVYDPLSDRPILPTYHMVTTVANPYPPYYYHRIDLDIVEAWVTAAQAQEVAVILDIQPGRGSLQNEFERIQHLFHNPHVHLAIDPEFTMAAGEIPAVDIGQLYAAQINSLQAQLNEIGAAISLNRVLILHQFTPSMLPDKHLIEDYPYVELVIDGDGVGSPQAKIRNYTQYAAEPGFEYGGFKLFPTDGDYPVLTPAEVMALEPQPVIIIYQ